jgi:tyrosine-protein kinase Etk/Wzc
MSNEKEISLVNLMLKIARHSRMIIINFVVVSVIAVIISLLLPKWYKAEAIIMPPVKEGSFGFGMGMAGELAGMMMGGGGDFDLPMFATPSDIYEMILKSKSVSDSLINRYNLMELYKKPTIEETRKALTSHTSFEVGKEGAIFIGFEAKEDPELAAAVTKSYIELLDKANRRTKVYYASNTRKFIEARIAQNERDMAVAADSLQAFQVRYNIVSIEDQVKAAVELSAQLMAMKQVYEVQLEQLKSSVAPTHGSVREMEAKIAAIDQKILQQKFGNISASGQAVMQETDFFPPFVKVPELGLELAKRMRDVKIQEIIYELLMQQLEQEKIKEARNTPTVVVLDEPVPPTKKSRPKRAIIVALSALLSIFFSIFVIFYKENMQELQEKNPAEYAKYNRLKSELRHLFRKPTKQ